MDVILDFLPVPAIVVICYLAAMGWIALVGDHEKKRALTPVLCGLLGGILGVVAFYVMPTFAAEDLLNAAATGIASGLAATGVNQIVKQQAKLHPRE